MQSALLIMVFAREKKGSKSFDAYLEARQLKEITHSPNEEFSIAVRHAAALQRTWILLPRLGPFPPGLAALTSLRHAKPTYIFTAGEVSRHDFKKASER